MSSEVINGSCPNHSPTKKLPLSSPFVLCSTSSVECYLRHTHPRSSSVLLNGLVQTMNSKNTYSLFELSACPFDEDNNSNFAFFSTFFSIHLSPITTMQISWTFPFQVPRKQNLAEQYFTPQKWFDWYFSVQCAPLDLKNFHSTVNRSEAEPADLHITHMHGPVTPLSRSSHIVKPWQRT